MNNVCYIVISKSHNSYQKEKSMIWLILVLCLLLALWISVKIGGSCPKCHSKFTIKFIWWTTQDVQTHDPHRRNHEHTRTKRVGQRSIKCFGCGYEGLR